MEATTSTQSDLLAAAIRRRIVSGEYIPGHRLPTYQEIEATYSVTRGVTQIAIERLKRDGFIDAAARRGLFVVPNPPHLRRYGIVFPITRDDKSWSRFDHVLVREYLKMQSAGSDKEFDVFAGITDSYASNQVLAALRDEVDNDMLAGLILTPGSFDLANQPPFDNPALPKVYIFGEQHSTTGTYPMIVGEGDSIASRPLQYLADKGCRRIAVIRVAGAFSSLSTDDFARHGLEFHPHWMPIIGRGDTTVIPYLVSLLLHGLADHRPDGLFILDDNITDYVVAAVTSMGLQIGKDIQVVALCNWPVHSPATLPIRRIGYKVDDILKLSVDAIDMMRRGQTPPDIQTVPALFEDEIGSVGRSSESGKHMFNNRLLDDPKPA